MKILKISSLFLLGSLLMLIAACGNKGNKHPEEFIIRGKFKNTKGEMVRLMLLRTDSIIPCDSAIIDENGAFLLRARISKPAFYLLKAAPDNFITLLVTPGEDIEVSGNFKQLAREYNVSGSSGSELIAELNTYTRRNYHKVDSLETELTKSQDSLHFAAIKKKIDSSYHLVFLDQQTFVKAFIDRNINSLASLIALYQVFGRVKVLNERDHFDYFVKLDKSLSALYPGNDYVTELHDRVVQVNKDEHERKLAEQKLDSGQVAPEIFMKDLAGMSCNLSSLKGRVVLVWFWAGWNEGSQKDVDTYKALHKKYRPKGFEIYSVSLDKDRQTWEDAVRRHKMPWVNVADLLEWNSPVVKTYALREIPSTLLIGRDGRIIKRGVSAQELPDFLYRQFKNKNAGQ